MYIRYNMHIMGEKSTFGAPINSKELHTAVSVAFSISSSVQSKNWWKTALIYSFIAGVQQK